MLAYAARRLLSALATLLGVLTLAFLLLAAAPGDPAVLAARSGGARPASAEALAAFRRLHGLDRPLPVQFATWAARAVRLDLGRSFQDGREVRERLAATLPATLLLNGGALLLALLAAVPCGVVAARRPGGRFDRASGAVFDLLFATPPFVLGLLLLLAFSVKLRLTPLFSDPAAGFSGTVLPVATLGLGAVALLSRFIRTCVRSALEDPAALAARARGESGAGSVRRALRRSAAAFSALGTVLVPSLVAGSVLVERLFSWPGAGRLLADGVFSRDVPVVLGLTLVAGAAVVLSSVAGDLVSAWLDPRLRDVSRGAPLGGGLP
ncbi:MAG TPA: ABC transporter permease [Thermoanaerobaculia bacterium]|nr:ABC transporter permease [Thermoanaerobaculia bacterium]